MKIKPEYVNPTTHSTIIRQKAEFLLKEKLSAAGQQLTEAEMQKHIHELMVHQIELELQNEELVLANERAKTETQKYTDLYDSAPTGYFTLSIKGEILGLNLRGAKMLGKERSLLIKSMFGFFVSDDTKPIFNLFLGKVFNGKANESYEVALSANGESLVYVQLTGMVTGDGEQCFLTAIDITRHKQAEDERLETSKERYRLLYENAKIGLYTTTPDGNIVLANKALVAMLGYSSFDELAKVNVEQSGFVSPQQRKEFLKKIEQSGEIESFEATWTRKDSTPVFVRESAQAIRDTNGDTLYYDGTVEDITKRKQAEEALIESEARYRLLFEKSADGILIADVETKRFKYANPALRLMLGYTEEEIGTLRLADIHPQKELHRIIAEFESQARGETILAPDIPCLRKDGSIVYADINSTNITIDGSVCAVGLFRDITERKLVNEALKKSELRFKQISENSQESIWEVDSNGLYTYISPVIKELLGYEAKEIIGLKYFYDLFEPENKEEMKQAALEAFARKESFRNFINYNIHKDGRKVILSTSGVPMLDNENNLIGYRGVDVDITERIFAEESLRQSEIQLQVIIESTADGILAIDSNGKVIKTNNRFAELWKIPPAVLNSGDDATLLNFVLEQLISPKQFLDKVKQLYNSTDEDSDTLFFKDGRIFERYSTPLILNDKIIGRVWSFRDITERKQAEEALIDSETHARALIDAIPDLIFRLNKQGVYLDYKAAKEELAFQTESIIGKKNRDMMPPEFADLVDEKISLTLQTRQIQVFEYQLPLPNRGICDFEARMVPGSPDEVIVIVRDVTERKKAEEKINMLAQAVKNSADCIAITDKDYKIIFVNDSFSKAYGFEKEEIVGQAISVITSKNNLPEVGHSLYSAMVKKEVWTGEVFNKRKDGNDFPVQLSLAPVINDKGEMIAVVGVLRDITERRLAEAELKLKNDQLLKLNAEKDKFFSIIAHDLRSPFNGFMGLTQLLTENTRDLTIDQILKISVNMRNSATHLFRLLENLLQWSRMQQGLIPFDPKVLKLLPVANECIEMHLASAKVKDIEITIDFPSDMEVLADSDMLQTVIRNLVSNAIKFTPIGGKINFSAKSGSDKTIEISISDTGIGMGQEMMGNLFRLDVQANRKGTEGEPSSGLGLLLCKEFVEKHGGKLWVESEEKNLPAGKSGGSTFYFTLP